MRISDWSSDVCSSDLVGHVRVIVAKHLHEPGHVSSSSLCSGGASCAENDAEERSLALGGRGMAPRTGQLALGVPSAASISPWTGARKLQYRSTVDRAS